MRLLCVVALVIACGDDDGTMDAAADVAIDTPVDTLVDAPVDVAMDAPDSRRCGVPEGAHPSVGAATPAPGWRCERFPFPLASPRDVWITDGGEVVVSEFGAGRIVRLEPDGFATIAEGLRTPLGLRQLPDGDLVVAEEHLGSIARIDPTTGSRTLIVDGMNAVTYIALGDDDAIYVSSFREAAPTGTGIVWRATLDGTRTELARDIGVPEGLFLDGDVLTVVDWAAPSVLRIRGDVRETLTTDIDQGYGLLDDGDGGILVGDHRGRVLRVRADGTHETWLDGIGRPGGLTRGPDGTVWIAEFVDFGETGWLIAVHPD